MGSVSKAYEVFQRYRRGVFSYGEQDCCTFARDVIQARYSIDVEYPVEYDGSYSSIKDNFKKAGALNLYQFLRAVAKANGWKRIWKNWLQPYDLVIVKIDRKYMAGIWLCGKAWVPGKTGLRALDNAYVSLGYRTGE